MLLTMRHRGPDDAGIAVAAPATLGHVRLSIQDLSAAGHQPMIDDESRYILVYNGEIYNFHEVRRDLERRGCRFRGHSDTEVLLHAYREWGEACLSRLSGMYAFAVWDAREAELFLARDRIGIKPLYYTSDGNAFAFASEIKSLLRLPWISRQVEHGALVEFLMLRYNTSPKSLFKGICKLEPAHVMRWKNGATRVRRYWRLEVPDRFEARSERQWIDGIRQRLEHSVREHLISDVPVGMFLSGGVDSNTIMSITTRLGGKPLETFSVGFSTEKGQDEIDKIRVSANHFGSTHHELILRPQIEELLPKVIYFSDEPNADPACVPTFLLSKLAAERVKVVLSGEGGDELFGGYERSLLMMYGYRYLRHVPQVLRSAGVGVLRTIPASLLDRAFKYTSKLGKRGFDRLNDFVLSVHDPVRAFIAASAVCNQREVEQMLSPDVLSDTDFEEKVAQQNARYFSESTEASFLNHELRYEIETRLWADLLMKLDGSSMPFSLEGRVPFLDHRLVEYSATIPPELKIRRLTEKSILRKAAKAYLPETIRKRKKDHFFVPIDKWLANELRPFVESSIRDDYVRHQGVFNLDYTRSVYEQYRNGSLVYARQLWNILVFQIWHQIYIENAFGFMDAVSDNGFRPEVVVI